MRRRGLGAPAPAAPAHYTPRVSFERYREAVDYLQRRLWHELPIVPVERALQGRIRQLLAHFGDPHERFPVVHVGGSAGKGSTAAIVAAILHAAGLRTGLYTSPHLQTFIERIAVDGRLIGPDEFAETVLGLDPLVRQMHLDVLDGTGFGRPALVEVAFAAGMKHFADECCDAAVVEVGLGGRTDCTNVFRAPAATVLTNVEYEHRERLGWSIAAIAREKAAIIHGGTAITGARRREALAVIERRCAETGAALWRLGREIRVTITAADPSGSVIDVATPHGRLRGLRLALAGAHQAKNAALAVAAAQAFADSTGAPLTEHAIRSGLERVRVNCRLERVQDEPCVLLDGAHNPVEARALAAALRAHWLRRGVRLLLVLGVLADKDQPAMLRALAPVADRAWLTQPPLAERIGDPERMLRLLRGALGARNVVFAPEPPRALDAALAAARPRDIVCVTGSMYLAGALRERWVPEHRILKRRSAALQGG
jgi:dihydrofolate synthase/folylpolyglutamate synthase